MSKRFTETTKWDDPWFRKLPVAYKSFWEFLRDRCDNAGVWKKDIDLASFFIGADITEEEALRHFNEGKERIVLMSEEAWCLVDFIGFQYGELSEDCHPHRQVIGLLEKYKDKGYQLPLLYPSLRVQDKDKDKEYLKKGGVGGNKKKTTPEVAVFIKHAFQTFQAKTEEKLCVDGKKDGAIVKKLLGTYGLEKLKGLWDVFIQSDDDPFIQQAGFSIGVFKSQVNKLVNKKIKKTEKPRLVL